MKQENIQILFKAGKVLFFVASSILLFEQVVGMQYKEDPVTTRLRKAGLL